MAIESQGMYVFFSTTTSVATGQIVEEVNSVSGPSGSASIIDITHLQSTAKEKLIGLRDEGQISINVNFMATAAYQTKIRECRATRTACNIAIGFNDTAHSMAKCVCYVPSFNISAGVDAKLTADITFELTGAIAWSSYTP